jgi:polysaccharide biosynthesis protein PslA
VLFVSFCLKADAHISRGLFGAVVVGASILLAVSRFAVYRGTNRFMGGPLTRELLIRDGVDIPAMDGLVVDAEAIRLDPDVRNPFSLNRLGQLVQPADRVIIACPAHRREAWALAMKGANVRAELVTPELNELGTLGCARYGGSTTLVISSGPLDLKSRAIKRALDLGLAITALAMLGPLLAVIAVAVRLETPGPVFFVQQRLGRGNRLFKMYKFRSMRAELCDAEGRQSTGRNDLRVTRVGRIIRATSIDELPQILNVLRGDMSFVGPRPHALGSLAESKLFWEVDGRYWHRHAAKPGITGLAQVRGFRGATALESDLLNRLQSDLDYLNGWSLRRDILILLATLKVILHKNAY